MTTHKLLKMTHSVVLLITPKLKSQSEWAFAQQGVNLSLCIIIS